MRVAIVHEWLDTYAGSERVLEQILACYPSADLYSIVDFLPEDKRSFLGGRRPTTSFIQRLPGARRHFRQYLSLMPLAVEQFDLSGYDLVVSSSHAVAKGVLTGPDQCHVSYVHSPMRYAWDMQSQYLRESGLDKGAKSWLARWMLHRLRLWDCRTAFGVDQFIANSRFIGRRIRKVYGRDAEIVPPPVDMRTFQPRYDKENFYVTASRMVPYKRIDLVVDAFAQMPDRRLVVIGDGPEMAKIRAKAGPNVTLLGYQDNAVMADHLRRARAFVFAAEEDFGILPVEAQACGTPVIAYGRGGVLDSVRGLDGDDPTGLFFTEQSAESIADAVRMFEHCAGQIRPEACRRNAETFAPDVFRARLTAVVDRAMSRLEGTVPAPIAAPASQRREAAE